MKLREEWSKIDFGEKIIIVMIGAEILLALGTIWLTYHEANEQDARLGSILTAQQKVDTDLGIVGSKLDQLNGGLSQTVGKLSDLNKNETDIAQRQADLLRQQYGIQKAQFEAQKRRPILQVRALLWDFKNPQIHTTHILKPKSGFSGEDEVTMNLWREGDRGGWALFVLRNIGDADATNINVRAQAVPDSIEVKCIDYGALGGCNSQSRITLTLPPRPKNRPERTPGQGRTIPDLDEQFDLIVEIHLEIPTNAQDSFTLVLTAGADGINPTRYEVGCGNPLTALKFRRPGGK